MVIMITSNPSRLIILFHHGIIISLALLLLARPGYSSSPPNPSPDPFGNQSFNPSMGVIIIVLVAALFFMGFFSIYIRHCAQDTSGQGITRRALNGSVARSRRAPRGLDRATIESFPTFDYAAVKSLKVGKGALECAVCLTEFEDHDTLRLIPKCDHVFHPDCIDAWLAGHVTCPVCRSNLISDPDNPTQQMEQQNNDVSLEMGESRQTGDHNNNNQSEDREEESMEQPLHGSVSRSRTMRRNVSFGRPRWLLGRMGRNSFTRSFSTGHVAVKQWEDVERFTLRLPEEVRKQVISGKLERTTSLLVLPRETSSRRGYRTGPGPGFGEGSSRPGRSGSVRSDRWVFSLAPPFISRAPSVRSSKGVAAVGDAANWDGSLRGSVRAEPSRLPV